MSNENFTPGPWHAHIGIMEPDYVYFGESEDKMQADADWQNLICGDVLRNIKSEDEHANAHLIAAAPEMHEDECENLEFLMSYLKSTKDLHELILNDSDVKATFQLNENLKKIHASLVWKLDLFERIIEQKIQITTAILKKARGEK